MARKGVDGKISGERYREILRYVIALEEVEDAGTALIDLLAYVIPYDAAMYIRLEKNGLLGSVDFATPGLESPGNFGQPGFCLQDPLFDFGNRASGMKAQETVCVDLQEEEEEVTARYHQALRERGIQEYLSFSIAETGEGIRLYRKEESPRFTEEDLAICEVLSAALRRTMPRHREEAEQKREFFYSAIVQKMYPFGILLYDESFRLLRYNSLALSRISEITGEQNFNDMMEAFTEIVRDEAREVVQQYEEPKMSHRTIADKYICEVVARQDLDERGELRSYYSVILYATQWFRDYLTDSVEVILVQYGLTEREIQVAGAVVQGLSNKEIAEQMYISVNTVKEHFKSIFRKMQVSSRGEMLLKIFIRRGNIEEECAEGECGGHAWS